MQGNTKGINSVLKVKLTTTFPDIDHEVASV